MNKFDMKQIIKGVDDDVVNIFFGDNDGFNNNKQRI